jgi:hypothetical protein
MRAAGDPDMMDLLPSAATVRTALMDMAQHEQAQDRDVSLPMAMLVGGGMSSDLLQKRTRIKYYDLTLQYLWIGIPTQFSKDREAYMRTRMLFLAEYERSR